MPSVLVIKLECHVYYEKTEAAIMTLQKELHSKKNRNLDKTCFKMAYNNER